MANVATDHDKAAPTRLVGAISLGVPVVSYLVAQVGFATGAFILMFGMVILPVYGLILAAVSWKSPLGKLGVIANLASLGWFAWFLWAIGHMNLHIE